MFKIFVFVLLASMTAQAQFQQISLTSKNTVVLRGPIDEASVLRTMEALNKLDSERKNNTPIYLILDSPGGSIMDGEDLIQYAKTIKNLHTISIFAASMASAVVQALPGQRYMTEYGVQMFHRATVGLSGQIENGELETRLNYIKNRVRSMEARSAARMSMKLEEYKERVKDEMWLNSLESLYENASDGTVDLICSQELIDKRETLKVSFLFFTVDLNFSGCPLFRTPKVEESAENKKTYEAHKEEVRARLSRGVLI